MRESQMNSFQLRERELLRQIDEAKLKTEKEAF